MKKISSPFILAITLLSFSCTKSSPGGGSNGGSNGNGGGNGGGGASNGLTISSISPANPYPDDEITINGTGFNADATKDTVEFGKKVGDVFAPWNDGDPDEQAKLVTIKSASATKLVIKAANPFPLDYNAFPSGNTSIAVMQIKAGGKKVISSVIPFKRLVVVSTLKNIDNNNAGIGRPNDSLVIGGKGFASSGVNVSIGGTSVPTIKVDSGASSGQIMFRLPKNFFGNENDETAMATKTVSVSNPDGKTIQKDFSFMLSPRMVVSSMKSDKTTYSLSTLLGSGGVIKITVTGKCLKDDATFTIANSTRHTTATLPLPVSSFQDNVILELTPATLETGNYSIRIWRNSALYGACDFTITS